MSRSRRSFSKLLRIALVDPYLYTLPYDQVLAGALAAAGHRVFLIGRALKAEERWTVAAVEHVALDLVPPALLKRVSRPLFLAYGGFRYMRSMHGLRRLLADLEVDLVHVQWLPLPPVDSVLVPRFCGSLPRVLTLHDTVPFNNAPAIALQKIGWSALLKSFDRLIVHTSQGVARLQEQGISGAQIVHIPHGPLEPGSGRILPRGCQSIARHESKVRFLLFGTMKPYKGIDVLIRAVRLMPVEIRKQCSFVIAGQPMMDLREIEAVAAESGLSHMIRFEPRHFDAAEIPALFGNADALVFPYREIEASGVLMLSLQFGLPIVASRLGAFAELLEHGRHGFLVEPENPEALAHALTAIVHDRERRLWMGRNVAALSAQLPSWKEIAQATVRVYHEALELQ